LQEFGVRAVTPDYAEDGPFGAMSRVAPDTSLAHAAAGIYLADHAFAHELGPVTGARHNTDKFMPDRPLKTGISADDLEVRIADARLDDANNGLVRAVGRRNIIERETAVCKS
jgi:hypothetical protein